jgi:hypothetical protein
MESLLKKPASGERGGEHREVRLANLAVQAAHVAHVLFAANGVNHAARGEKEERFEEGVGHQMKNARGERADAARQEHVPELADGGVGENALDVRLHEADRRGEEGGGAADNRNDEHRGGRMGEQHVGARHDVDAGGHHGGGVDQRADGRGAFHGVGQPDVER